MDTFGLLQIVLYLVVLLALVKPLGWYMARVYEGKPVGLDRVLGPVERLVYRLCDVDPRKEVGWKRYALGVLAFNAAGFIFLYVLQRVQHFLPLNPEHLAAVKTHTAFNTAVSFVTNTNWQSYGGETTMSYLTQMLGMTVQNFVSAATAMAVLVAMIRGFARRNSETIGNFWVGYDEIGALHPAAGVDPLGGALDVPGRRADVQLLSQGGPHRTRQECRRQDDYRADPGGRSGGVTDRHQADRHQRRRILQRQFRPSV